MMNTEAPAIESDGYAGEEKLMSSLHHSIIQFRLGVAFSPFSDYSVLSELWLELPDGERLTPDIAVYPKIALNWRLDVLRMTALPKLVVEIFSPTQGYLEIEEKLNLYFKNRVESVWVVHPAMQTIAIYLPNAPRPRVFSTGEAKDPVTGLTVQVEEVFA